MPHRCTVLSAIFAVTAAAGLVAAPTNSQAQESIAGASVRAHFFATEEPLAVRLVMHLNQIRRDKADGAPWRPATIAWAEADGSMRNLPLEVRTRGIWRLKNCQFPPLRLNFGRRAARDTPFNGLDKPKLVNYCRDATNYEQFVLQELQLYRIFALLTPVSHRTRLMRITYVDSARGTTLTERYAFVLEEPDDLAGRVGGALFEVKGAVARDLNSYQAALVGVFQYMIGNSDWSAGGLHNAELVRDSTLAYDSNLLLVPYDFDFSGAVNTPYATADPTLPIRRVRDRLYRGHCAPPEEYARVFTLFREKQDAIYALYADPIGRLLEPRRVKETLDYFDAFYATITSDRAAKRDILDKCHLGQ